MYIHVYKDLLCIDNINLISKFLWIIRVTTINTKEDLFRRLRMVLLTHK